jgi:hypothetical protein
MIRINNISSDLVSKTVKPFKTKGVPKRGQTILLINVPLFAFGDCLVDVIITKVISVRKNKIKFEGLKEILSKQPDEPYALIPKDKLTETLIALGF